MIALFSHYIFKIPLLIDIVPERHQHLKNSLSYGKRKTLKLNANFIQKKLELLEVFINEDLKTLKVSKFYKDTIMIES